MIDTETAANVLFGATSKPSPSAATQPAAAPTVLDRASPQSAAQAPAQTHKQPPLDPPGHAGEAARTTQAQSLYGGDAAEGTSYDTALATGFDALEHKARYDQNQDDVVALRDGRKAADATLRELAVPAPEARELTIALSEWSTREPMSDAVLAETNERTLATLRREWGQDFQRNLSAARAAYEHAVAKLPWLDDLCEAGAGSQPAVIRHFSRIGLRMQKGRR